MIFSSHRGFLLLLTGILQQSLNRAFQVPPNKKVLHKSSALTSQYREVAAMLSLLLTILPGAYPLLRKQLVRLWYFRLQQHLWRRSQLVNSFQLLRTQEHVTDGPSLRLHATTGPLSFFTSWRPVSVHQ